MNCVRLGRSDIIMEIRGQVRLTFSQPQTLSISFFLIYIWIFIEVWLAVSLDHTMFSIFTSKANYLHHITWKCDSCYFLKFLSNENIECYTLRFFLDKFILIIKMWFKQICLIALNSWSQQKNFSGSQIFTACDIWREKIFIILSFRVLASVNVQ